MSVIQCRACKKPISSQAKSCPSCGHPNQREVSGMTALLVISALLIFMCWLGFRSPERPTAESNTSEAPADASASVTAASGVAAAEVAVPDLSDSEKVVLRGIITDDVNGRFNSQPSMLIPPAELPIVESEELQSYYRNNAVEADKKFGKNYFIVVGHFLSVERNFDDGYVVLMPYLKAEVASKDADFLSKLHTSDFMKMACRMRDVVLTQVRLTGCMDTVAFEQDEVKVNFNWISILLRFGGRSTDKDPKYVYPKGISLAIVTFMRTMQTMNPQDSCQRTWGAECHDKVEAAMYEVPQPDRDAIMAEVKHHQLVLDEQVTAWLKGADHI